MVKGFPLKRSVYVERADIAMSLAVRLRDSILTSGGDQVGRCISCDGWCSTRYNENLPPQACGTAGHYIPRGNYTLRWNLFNVNLQCRWCNEFLHGNIDAYREGLIKRYGLDVAEKLESARFLQTKFSKPEIVEKQKFFIQMRREMKKRHT